MRKPLLSVRFALIVTAFILAPITTQADIGQTVRDKIRETDLTLKLNAPDISILDLLKVEAGAGLSVIPNLDKETYSRSETFSVQASLSPQQGFTVPGTPITLGAGILQGSELEIIRQFPSQRDALNLISNPPYRPSAIPTSSEKARALAPTDYVRYKSRMALHISAGLAASQGVVSLGANFTYMVYGDFQLELYRKPEDKVILRATALKEKSRTVSLSLNWNLPTVQVLGISQADKAIRKALVPTNFLTASASSSKGDLFIVEYEYDLSNADARAALDKILNPAEWVGTAFKIQNPTKTGEEVLGALLVELAPTESIVSADIDRGREDQRIRSLTRGRSEFNRQNMSLNINLQIAKGGANSGLVVQDFTLQDHENRTVNKFRLANYSKSKSGQLFFGVLKAEHRVDVDALLELDSEDQISRFVELSFHVAREDRIEFAEEREKVRTIIRRMLPDSEHAVVAAAGGEIVDTYNKNARYDIELVFHQEAFNAIRTLTVSEIEAEVDAFIKAYGDTQYGIGVARSGYYGFVDRTNTSGYGDGSNFTKSFAYNIAEIREKLPKILSDNAGLSAEVRWELFLSLRDNALFRSIAPGFLTRILHNHEDRFAAIGISLEDTYSFSFSSTSRQDGRIAFNIGDRERSAAFRNLVALKNRLLERRFDPSYFETLGE